MGGHREEAWLLPVGKRASSGTGRGGRHLDPGPPAPRAVRQTFCGLSPRLVLGVAVHAKTTSEGRDQARLAAQPLAQDKLHIPTQIHPEGMNQ